MAAVLSLISLVLAFLQANQMEIIKAWARRRLGSYMVRTAIPRTLIGAAALIGGRDRKWRVSEWAVDLVESPAPTRYALSLVRASLRMRISDLGGLMRRGTCWVLVTEVRTWTPLTALLVWGGVETTLDTGLGAAILAVVGAGAVFQTGVKWLRGYLGVEVRQRKKAAE